MKFELKGIDGMLNKLDEMSKKADEYEGEGKEVGFDQLFNKEFLSEFTDFSSIQEFFDKSPFEINSEEDIQNANEKQMADWVTMNTKFSSWGEMFSKAQAEFMAKDIGFK